MPANENEAEEDTATFVLEDDATISNVTIGAAQGG